MVADVVGTRNPRYCLFGDTGRFFGILDHKNTKLILYSPHQSFCLVPVNTASRMESNSDVNRIHCSRAAAKLLQKQAPELPLKSRGNIEIKGKGIMHTYWCNEKGGRGVNRTGSNKSLDSSDEDMKPRRDSSAFPLSNTLLTDTKIEPVTEAPSLEIGSTLDINGHGNGTSDRRLPEMAPEPTPFEPTVRFS